MRNDYTDDDSGFSTHLSVDGDSGKTISYDLRKLFTAVIDRAYQDLQQGDCQIRKDAFEWFNENNENNTYLFSFRNICFNLDIDPVMVLEKLFK